MMPQPDRISLSRNPKALKAIADGTTQPSTWPPARADTSGTADLHVDNSSKPITPSLVLKDKTEQNNDDSPEGTHPEIQQQAGGNVQHNPEEEAAAKAEQAVQENKEGTTIASSITDDSDVVPPPPGSGPAPGEAEAWTLPAFSHTGWGGCTASGRELVALAGVRMQFISVVLL